jgi:hypothetical protein
LTLHDVDGRLAGRPLPDTADGAYDQNSVYGEVAALHPDAVVIVLPQSSIMPSATAKIAPTWRDQYLQIVAKCGRPGWQKMFCYNWLAPGRSDISRLKRAIGGVLRWRTVLPKWPLQCVR